MYNIELCILLAKFRVEMNSDPLVEYNLSS
jgi:hypothetical protein